MRRAVLPTLAVLLAICGGMAPVIAASPEPAANPLRADDPALAAIRGLDPRFADLPDYADVSRQVSSCFDPRRCGSWIHVLPTFDQLGAWFSLFGDPAWRGLGRVVEVMLVADCQTPGTFPSATHPCGWRHTWLYRVLHTGEVTPLLDAGSPTPTPGRGFPRHARGLRSLLRRPASRDTPPVVGASER